jgi:hypothetical protein
MPPQRDGRGALSLLRNADKAAAEIECLDGEGDNFLQEWVSGPISDREEGCDPLQDFAAACNFHS